MFDDAIVLHGYSAPDDQIKPVKPARKPPTGYKKFQFETHEKECYYCEGSIGRGNKTKDHVHPRSKGGTLPGNFVWACNKCNHHKGDKTIEEWRDHLLDDEMMAKDKGHLRGHKNKILKKLNYMIEKLKTI